LKLLLCGETLPYCSKCGTKLEEDAKFCIKCGTAVTEQARVEKERRERVEWWQ